MITITSDNLDWVFIRQALSLSLLKQVPVTVRNAVPFLEKNPPYKYYLYDLKDLAESLGAGRLERSGDDVSFQPLKLQGWSFVLQSGNDSALTEALLLLAPALFQRRNRTLLKAEGVTHPVLSGSLKWMNDTLFSILQNYGLISGSLLKRYGFHGAGEGAAEVRVYPAEPVDFSFHPGLTECAYSDAGIVFSGPFMRESADIRDVLSGEPGFDEKRVRILEVRDSSGSGFYIYSALMIKIAGGEKVFPLVISGAVDTTEGREHFDLEVYRVLSHVINTARRTKESMLLPAPVAREVLLYSIFFDKPGIDAVRDIYKGDGEIESTVELLEQFRQG